MGALIVAGIVFFPRGRTQQAPAVRADSGILKLLDTDNPLVSRYLHIQSLFTAANQEESK